MRLLIKNAGILAWKDGRFDYIPEGFLGIDGDTIDYVGAQRPKAEYDREKDMRGKLLVLSRNAYASTPVTGAFVSGWSHGENGSTGVSIVATKNVPVR